MHDVCTAAAVRLETTFSMPTSRKLVLQEWYADPSDGTISERGSRLCLCPDTRNSPSMSTSLTFTATPSPSHAPLPQQRITTCDCDGSDVQSWTYAPSVGSIGPVLNRKTLQCWALVTDNCAVARDDDGGFTACVELQVSVLRQHCGRGSERLPA